MLWLVLGGLVLFAFLGGLRAFERASIASVKALLAWIAALGGILLALLLVLTGRGAIAIGALTLFGPLIWQHWRAANPPGGHTGAARPPPASAGSKMTREEAYQVLGLEPGANEAAIRAAHHRLMRAAHPDSGGSDWLAARINQARDVLLSRS
jgi:DnaJ homolog subfamily C member 19